MQRRFPVRVGAALIASAVAGACGAEPNAADDNAQSDRADENPALMVPVQADFSASLEPDFAEWVSEAAQPFSFASDGFGFAPPFSDNAPHVDPIPTILATVPLGPMDESCFQPGEEVVIMVELLQSQNVIAGGQFLLRYDPRCLFFVDAVAGAECDPLSVFTVPIHLEFDETEGLVFYAVGASFAVGGTTGPAVMACLSFSNAGACPFTQVCFDSENPRNTILTNRTGASVPFELVCAAPVRTCQDAWGGSDIEPTKENINADVSPSHVRWKRRPGCVAREGSPGQRLRE